MSPKFETPKPIQNDETEEFEVLDETKVRPYSNHIFRKILKEKIDHVSMVKIKRIAEILMGSEPSIEFDFDGERVFTFPRNEDPVMVFLAEKMIAKLWDEED